MPTLPCKIREKALDPMNNLSSTQPPVMTLKQVSAYLQVSKAHLSNVIGGKVPGVPQVRFFRLGRRILIKREWLEEWLEAKPGRIDE